MFCVCVHVRVCLCEVFTVPEQMSKCMGVFLHENVALKHVNLNSTPNRGWPVVTPSTPHTHTHWGDAAGHRTEQGRLCSAHTAGWRPVGRVRQHEHTPPTPGSGVGLWSEREREDRSAVHNAERHSSTERGGSCTIAQTQWGLCVC